MNVPLRHPAVHDPAGNKLADVIDVFSLNCCACHQPIYPSAPLPIYALGPPYFGLVHRDCIHIMPFTGAWPHASPMLAYFTTSSPTSIPRLDQRTSQ